MRATLDAPIEPGSRPEYERMQQFLTSSMHTFLEQFRGQCVRYLPNPGNAGDSLIHTGTYQAFRRAGVAFVPIREDDDISGQILFLGGGGNLVPHYREMRDFIISKRVLDRVERLIILPHTIRANEDLLAMMDKRVTIFCRETGSYVHVSRNAGTPNVYIDHDMAFHTDLNVFQADCWRMYDLPDLAEKNWERSGVDRNLAAFDGELRTFREDGESQGGMAGEHNVDVARVFEFGTWPTNAEKATWCLFQTIKRARKVTTDRLHVGIASLLLGVPCDLHDNNYGKNSGIYEHSMRKLASTVTLLSKAKPEA